MKQAFRSVRGTLDFYPPQTYIIEKIYATARALFALYGYEPILLPHLEAKGLFEKSVGAITDIVQKQTFKIESKEIVLRPEGTAQVARFYIQNNLNKQKEFHKFYYTGSMFRGERPQKGRFREFHHIGIEAIGSASIHLDAEVILLLAKFFRSLGVKDLTIVINSLGCQNDKNKLQESIKEQLNAKKDSLCDNCQKRLLTSPLRVLDCKNETCKRTLTTCAITSDHLCKECHAQFFDLLALLDKSGTTYRYDPRLVRGLDYYTNTVFEVTSADLGAQDAVAAGGRYNNLIESLGGPSVPAIGFAIGLERVLLLLPQERAVPATKVLVAIPSERTYSDAYAILGMLRDAEIAADIDYLSKPLKTQLKNAQKANVLFVVIAGDDEIKEGCVMLRNMRESVQEKIPIRDLVARLKRGCAC